jgi:hypothetical protein
MKYIKTFESFLNEDVNYIAPCGVNDHVEYSTGPDEEPRHGIVARVAFTKGKTWYDILDDDQGEVIKEVDSVFVKQIETQPA